MKKKVVKHDELICIIDRSGSMSSMGVEAINGLNCFIEDQKKIKKPCKITFVLFDHTYETPFYRVDMQDVTGFDDKTYVPRGNTALFDAIGDTISKFSTIVSDEKDNIDKVLVAILTDGEENASQTYKKQQIAELIAEKTKENWVFMFLAANQDAFGNASSINIPARYTSSYSNTKNLVISGCDIMSHSITSCRIDSGSFNTTPQTFANQDSDIESNS